MDIEAIAEAQIITSNNEALAVTDFSSFVLGKILPPSNQPFMLKM